MTRNPRNVLLSNYTRKIYFIDSSYPVDWRGCAIPRRSSTKFVAFCIFVRSFSIDSRYPATLRYRRLTERHATNCDSNSNISYVIIFNFDDDGAESFSFPLFPTIGFTSHLRSRVVQIDRFFLSVACLKTGSNADTYTIDRL